MVCKAPETLFLRFSVIPGLEGREMPAKGGCKIIWMVALDGSEKGGCAHGSQRDDLAFFVCGVS